MQNWTVTIVLSGTPTDDGEILTSMLVMDHDEPEEGRCVGTASALIHRNALRDSWAAGSMHRELVNDFARNANTPQKRLALSRLREMFGQTKEL